MNGNTHCPYECPYCWRVLYSKGALTNHVNTEHWKEKEAEQEEVVNLKLTPVDKSEMVDERS
jgi:hypothetical protein